MNLSKTAIGIEFGSTRIKAVLLDESLNPAASGSFEWENQLVDGIWTYPMDLIIRGMQTCFADLKNDVQKKYGLTLTTTGAIGISGMMHGYLPFDKDGKQLAEFRTWRNTITGEAAQKLTEEFHFAIPQRWSIAHLYQAMLNKEEHVKDIAMLTTLAGYIHYRLTGLHIMGIGEASGMFPIDPAAKTYYADMAEKFEALNSYDWKLLDILPKAVCAGEEGGILTEEGALLLDPAGDFKAGVPVAPCEGDAGTGMVATNSVRPRTGNVSAGTSDFAMIVTKNELGVHREIDIVTTPAGENVAMVHCNNCTSDINAWVNLFADFAAAAGITMDKGELFTMLFKKALEGEKDGGGLLSYNYFSGEGVTDIDEGRPAFLRFPNAQLNLANFMRTHLMSALATLKIGLDILTEEEKIEVDKIYGHGGFFKTPGVGQTLLSAAIGSPVSVMESAGEGGPYGMALLAAFMVQKEDGESLEDYLDNKVFAGANSTTIMADAEDIEGFNKFLSAYRKAFPVEKAAVETM